MTDSLRIEEIIEKDGMYVSTVSGYSMSPMLKDKRDTVVIVPPRDKIRRHDVVLYYHGGRYILHRVVKAKNGSYVMCGDNRTELEYGIMPCEIVGVLSEVYRGEKKLKLSGVGYRSYCAWIRLMFYPRRTWRRIRSLFSRAARKK
jgi:hypothetical protein